MTTKQTGEKTIPLSGLKNGILVEFIGKPPALDGAASLAATGAIGRVQSFYPGDLSHGYAYLILANGLTKYVQEPPDKSEPIFRVLTSKESREWEDSIAEETLKRQIKEGFPKCLPYSTGTDPEVFALDKHGKVVPAFNWLPSKKNSGSGAFWDGFQAEFNPRSHGCLQGLQGEIKNHLDGLRKALESFDSTARLAPISVVDVDEEFLAGLPEEYVALGCLASKSAYEDEEPLEVEDPRKLLYRTAGCHMHFGIGRQYDNQLVQIIKTVDSIGGVAMTALFQGMEDPRRRKLYGRAGEYRTPSHGVEYRVPPAEVLCHPIIYMLCFDLCRQAVWMGVNYPKIWEASEEQVREVINNSDVKGALKILKKNKEVLMAMAKGLYLRSNVQKNFETLVFTGAKNWLPVEKFHDNWKLDNNMTTVPEGWEMSQSHLIKQGKRDLTRVAAA